MAHPRDQSHSRANRRERILALTRSLLADVETLDLQEIDGEFFWRICRDDLFAPEVESAASFVGHDAAGPMCTDQPHPNLSEEQQIALSQSTSHLGDTLPSHVRYYLRRGKHLPLRPTYLSTAQLPLRICIYSRAWDGDRLEEILDEFVIQSWREGDQEPVEQTSLQINFALVREPRPGDPIGGDEPDSFPFVEVIVAYPIPPRGVVGAAYDAIVREQQRWHLELPGGETRQEKEVAIRTWAIGLLMHEGDSFGQAVRALEPHWGEMTLSQEADRQARNRLLERVPEARLYLGTR